MDHGVVDKSHLETGEKATDLNQQNCSSKVVDGEVVVVNLEVVGEWMGVSFEPTQFDHCECQIASSSSLLFQLPA